VTTVLVVNAGSTSLKLSIVAEDGTSTKVDDFVPADAVGHRIVHFGDLVVDAALIDDWLLRYIEDGAEIAPLHNRPALDAIARAQAALPDVPHVAVSDAHFHSTMPEEARRYAIPEEWRTGYGVVRHGFHGLAVQWVAERIPVPRLVVCHLGGGCSVTAVEDGRSVDTTMGLTPLEGVPMGTRSGSIDPGALIHLMRQGVGADELDQVLNEEAGLAALGGLDNPFAGSYFAYHVAKAVAAMAAVLGGLDAVAFSGGIGENRADVRSAVADRLGFLGVELDAEANAAAQPDSEVATAGSAVRVHVTRAREDLVIARAVRELLTRPGSDDGAT
jgi:acetate kinase